MTYLKPLDIYSGHKAYLVVAKIAPRIILVHRWVGGSRYVSTRGYKKKKAARHRSDEGLSQSMFSCSLDNVEYAV